MRSFLFKLNNTFCILFAGDFKVLKFLFHSLIPEIQIRVIFLVLLYLFVLALQVSFQLII